MVMIQGFGIWVKGVLGLLSGYRLYGSLAGVQREFFIDKLLVRIHFIIVMIKWTGLAPWEFEFPFPGSPTSTFLPLTPNPLHDSKDS